MVNLTKLHVILLYLVQLICGSQTLRWTPKASQIFVLIVFSYSILLIQSSHIFNQCCTVGIMDVISNIDYTRHFHLQLGFLPSLSERHSGISLLLHHDQPCGEPSVVGNETSDYNQQETETCQQPYEWASSSPSQAFSPVTQPCLTLC